MSLKAKALSGVLWNLVEVVGTQGTAFLVFVLLARLLEPEAFGLVALAGTVIILLTIFVEAGFSTVIVRSEEITEEKLNTAFWIGVLVSTSLALALTLSAGWVAELYGTPELTPVLRALSWVLLFGALSAVHTALLVRKLDFRSKALRRLVAVVGGGIAGIAMALSGFGVWSLVAKQAVEAVLDCIVVWRTSDWRPGLRVSRRDAGELLSFGRNIVGSSLVSFLNRSADDLIIGVTLGPVALGYYAVAYRANVAVTEVALRATSRTALPVFAKLQGEPARLRTAFYAAVEFAALVACPIFLGLSATAPELCLTMFGPKWEASVRPMQVLGLAGLVAPITLYLGPILIAIGQPKWFFRFSFVQGILNILAFWIAVRWGILAVAWAFVIRSAVTFPLVLWLMSRAIGSAPREILRLVSAPAVASLAMLGAVAALRPALGDVPAPVGLALLVGAGAITYLALMSLIARSTVTRFFDVLRAGRKQRVPG
jgi:PST family polysaccharide transporter